MSEVPTGMLRDTLRGRSSASPSPECLDAETAAAWADDTLNRRERAAVEAHAADCTRCQAMIAALARTAPPSPARSWWRLPVMTWLVPLTAAAAALLVYVNVSYRARQAAPVSTAAVASAAAGNPARERKADDKPVDQLVAAKAPPDNIAGRGAAQGFAPAQPGPSAERRTAEARALRDAKASASGQANAVAAAEAPATLPPPPPAAAPSPAPATAAAPLPAARAELAPPAPLPTADATREFARRAPAPMMLKAVEAQPTIFSPNPGTRWRIIRDGDVERSTDGGATWQRQATGVTVTLTSGMAPSPTICWLVGPGGIVLRSTDGRSWQRVVFPEAADLSSIRATDDKTATVTTADSRAFSTTDGGATWTR